MADEAVRAPALGGVTERLDAQDDAHGADDDDVPITRSEGTKQFFINHYLSASLLQPSGVKHDMCDRLSHVNE